MKIRLTALLASALVTLAALAATQWKTDPAQSTLKFSGVQAGAAFEGTFQKFNANIQFDPQDLAGSRFDVTIDLKSAYSKDKDRDQTLQGPDFFDVKRWPSGHYVTDKIADKGGGKFAATGKLTLRDVTKDIPLDFTFQPDAAGGWLKGTAQLKRLDFGVGQGEWKDTSWVGNEIKIQFVLRLQK
jgi:polyisoprenoid-binding protein YceI